MQQYKKQIDKTSAVQAAEVFCLEAYYCIDCASQELPVLTIIEN
jgi:hypothetical protein